MKILVAVTISAILVGCTTPLPKGYQTVGKPTKDPDCPDYSDVEPGFYGGNGSSEDQAIEAVGIDYDIKRWLKENYPNAKLVLQELVISPGNQLKYDRFVYEVDGKNQEVWFWLAGGMTCLLKTM